MSFSEEVQRQAAILEQAQKEGRVVGLKDVTKKVLNRADIDLMVKNQPDTFNLYLLALEFMQDEKMSQGDKMNWFDISGIHGLPQEWWDGVSVPDRDPSEGEGSYCPHGTILFPTWHRPYLAMMEQSIYYRMLKIAQEFGDKERYAKAAMEFRLPFWDYFRPRGGKSRFPGVTNPKTGATVFKYDYSVPQVLELEEVMVQRPGGDEPEVMDNPLYQFRFPKKGSVPAKQWDLLWEGDQETDSQGNPSFTMQASRSRTVRQATRYNNQKSDYLKFNSLLSQARENNVEMMLNMLRVKEYKSYITFSCSRFDFVPSGGGMVYGSVESLHNRYHGLCGGEGHMSRVPVAAFDPIFWLHHCNIDRMIAIWQAINPKVGWPSPAELEKYNITESNTDSLYPFRTPKGTGDKPFWNSANAWSIDTFGYTFAELQENKTPDALLKAMHDEYQWSLQKFEKTQPIPEKMKPLDLSKAPVFQYYDRTVDSMLSREDVALKPAISDVKPLLDHTAPVLHSTLMAVQKSAPEATIQTALLQPATIAEATDAVVVKDPSKEIGADLPLSEGKPNLPDEKLLADSGKPEGTQIIRQWFVDSVVERSALNGAFSIYYFIGDFPPSLTDYKLAPTLAGLDHIFAAPKEACDNCGRQQQSHMRVASTNPITAMLLDYVKNGALADLTPEKVVPFLRANLHWRVVGINRNPKASDEVPGLEINVSSTVSFYHPDTVVPEFIGGQAYPEVTAQRAGGVAGD